MQKVRIDLPEDFQKYLITLEEATKAVKDDRAIKKLDNDIEIDTLAVKIAPKITYLERVSKQYNLVSAKNMSAINKIKSGRFNFSKSERNAFAFLISSLEEKGVGIESIING